MDYSFEEIRMEFYRQQHHSGNVSQYITNFSNLLSEVRYKKGEIEKNPLDVFVWLRQGVEGKRNAAGDYFSSAKGFSSSQTQHHSFNSPSDNQMMVESVLSDEEIKIWNSDKFVLGKVPERPPPLKYS
jgi:hypothetical protein